MKRSSAWILGFALTLVIVGGTWFWMRSRSDMSWNTITPSVKNFIVTLPNTGVVEPHHKITIRPPVAGRLDKIVVEEGQQVEEGQILAWISSTDRAALIDAARAQGPKAVAEWSQVYRPTPIISPSQGTIIRVDIVKGQTIDNTTHLFELSDKLIVRSFVDENDIGHVSKGQKTEILVDAFPNEKLQGQVLSIAHSSDSESSVTAYEVIIEPTHLPSHLKVGMTSTVHFVVTEKQGATLLPTWIANGKENTQIEVFVKGPQGDPIKQTLNVGESNGEFIEVLTPLAKSLEILYQPVELRAGASGPLGILSK